MELITTILGAIGGGGITGIVGGLLSHFRDKAAAKLELERMDMQHKHRMAEAQAERELMLMEAEKEIRISEVEGAAIEAKAHYEAIGEGLKAAKWDVGDTKQEGIILRFIEGMRRAVRPVASFYSMAVLTVITLWVMRLWEEMGLVMTQAQAFDLSMQMLAAVVYISSTVILWWFSTRGLKMNVGR
jgi:hypothetical protein